LTLVNNRARKAAERLSEIGQMAEPHLPGQFPELEPFLNWALATERERTANRQSSTMSEIRAFYNAMVPRLEEILNLLAKYSPEDPPSEVQRLFLMTLSLAEIAPAVENFGQPGVIDGFDFARFIPAQGQ
jgi:hypothetical protein